jgi:hypothetical protein
MAKTTAPVTVTTWAIANLERETADGKVIVVHYTVNATNGTYSAGAYGSLGFDGEVTTPFADLTKEVVVGWVKEALGADKVAEVEAALQNQIDEQAAPTKAAGTPW